jgi:UBX domain-containing protein 1/4
MTSEPPKRSEPQVGGDDSITEADAAAIVAALAEENPQVAKSLKCIDCGKLFKNADLANYHAEKSGHENFEESVEEVFLCFLL